MFGSFGSFLKAIFFQSFPRQRRLVSPTGESYSMNGRDLIISPIASVEGLALTPGESRQSALVVMDRGKLDRNIPRHHVITVGSLPYLQSCLQSVNRLWRDGQAIAIPPYDEIRQRTSVIERKRISS